MSNKEKLYLFQEISKAISSTLALNEITELIVKKMAEVLNLKGCTIRLVNPRTKTLELLAATGVSEKYLKGPVDLDQSASEVLRGRPVAIYDATIDPRIQYPQLVKEEGIASLVTIPILTKGRVIGVMRLLTSEPRDFLLDEVDFACAVADLGGQGIINARIYGTKVRELEFLKALQQVAKAINSSLEVQ